ncbi:MAG: GNAT family N-acetyltransferase [Acidobacteria bacterium]|nr:GNAT family N-acetyltransferase [Acidobacteriota bacterium]
MRTVTEDDRDFIARVDAGTREEEFAGPGWSPRRLAEFLKMQAVFQRRAWELRFPGALQFIIEDDFEKVGRMITAEYDDRLVLIDIAILPAHRGRGIGSLLIGDLIERAVETRKKVALQVSKNNLRAVGLYRKLGFAVERETESDYSMTYSAER